MKMTPAVRKSRYGRIETKCQSCKRRKAVWRVGSDGFSAKAGALVCDNYGCRTWADGGYPVTFNPIKAA